MRFPRKRRVPLLTLSFAVVASVGCTPPGTIRAEAVDEHWRIVADRHDAYVRADPSLDQGLPPATTYLRSTQIIRDQLDAASVAE